MSFLCLLTLFCSYIPSCIFPRVLLILKTRSVSEVSLFTKSQELKGTSGRKKSLAQMKECEKCKKRAITDLNAPNGSRDIPFQSQEFEQYGRRHFVDF